MAAVTAAGAQARPLTLTGYTGIDSEGLSEELTPTITGAAGRSSSGTDYFPIVRGRIDSRTLRGSVAHRGGFEFFLSTEQRRRGRRVPFTGLLYQRDGHSSVISARVSVRRSCRLVRRGGRRCVDSKRIALLSLSRVRMASEDGRAVVKASARFAPAAAIVLNRRLRTRAYRGGLDYGDVTVGTVAPIDVASIGSRLSRW